MVFNVVFGIGIAPAVHAHLKRGILINTQRWFSMSSLVQASRQPFTDT
jgi:hypothetical protein